MDADRDFLLWLSGFIDGEGCFIILKDNRHVTNYTPRFSLGLREDDAEILFEIVDQLGIGQLYRRPKKHSPSNPQLHWYVANTHDVLILAEILDEFPLRTKKVKDYRLWREAVRVYIQKPVDKARMAILFSRLKLVREFNSNLPEEPEPDTWQLALWDENMEE